MGILCSKLSVCLPLAYPSTIYKCFFLTFPIASKYEFLAQLYLGSKVRLLTYLAILVPELAQLCSLQNKNLPTLDFRAFCHTLDLLPEVVLKLVLWRNASRVMLVLENRPRNRFLSQIFDFSASEEKTDETKMAESKKSDCVAIVGGGLVSPMDDWLTYLTIKNKSYCYCYYSDMDKLR